MDMAFKIKTIKSAGQSTGDVQSIWMACDPDISIHPNVFADNEVIETRYYLPQRNLQIENKDKEPCEQEPHIQAPTIKTKLISLNRLIDFVEERRIYIGLTPKQLEELMINNKCIQIKPEIPM